MNGGADGPGAPRRPAGMGFAAQQPGDARAVGGRTDRSQGGCAVHSGDRELCRQSDRLVVCDITEILALAPAGEGGTLPTMWTARERAESLANALAKQGLEVADLRESAAAVRTELSFSYTPDEAVAPRR